MFDTEFTAEITKVSVSVKEADGTIRRSCKLVLSREYDWLIAESLGIDGRRVLDALSQGGIEDATIPMDALIAKGTLKALGGAKVEIPLLRGLKAKAKAGKEDEDPPTVRLEFECDFSSAVWIFLGENCSAYAQVTLSRLQTEFAYEAGVGAEKRTEA